MNDEAAPEVVTRGPGRPRLHPEAQRPEVRASNVRDPKARAAELRKQMEANPVNSDKFALPPNAEPPGWTYEWKRDTTYNKEDPAYQVSLAQAGWEPVPAERHPAMMPTHYQGMTIDREGMRLMERPTEIVREAQERDLDEAYRQVNAREEALRETKANQMERTAPRLRRSYGREGIAIDKD